MIHTNTHTVSKAVGDPMLCAGKPLLGCGNVPLKRRGGIWVCADPVEMTVPQVLLCDGVAFQCAGLPLTILTTVVVLSLSTCTQQRGIDQQAGGAN
jgi:hypothetical protein